MLYNSEPSWQSLYKIMNLAKIDVTQDNVAILLRNHEDPEYTIINKLLKIAFLFVLI